MSDTPIFDALTFESIAHGYAASIANECGLPAEALAGPSSADAFSAINRIDGRSTERAEWLRWINSGSVAPIYDQMKREEFNAWIDEAFAGFARARAAAAVFTESMRAVAQASLFPAFRATPSARRGGKSAALIRGSGDYLLAADETGDGFGATYPIVHSGQSAQPRTIARGVVTGDGRVYRHPVPSPAKEPLVRNLLPGIAEALAVAKQVYEIDAKLARRADSLVPPPRRNPDRGVRKP